MRTLLAFVSFLVLGLVAGFFLGHSQIKQQEEIFKIQAIRTAQNGLVNPLLEYEIPTELYGRVLRVFKDDIQKVVDQKIQNQEAKEIAIYFRGLNNGPWFGIKQDDPFFPASLLKVPIMIAYFKWTEENPEILKKEIKYEEGYFKLLGNFNNVQYFQSENPIEVDKTYTVQELIERMITDSDNNAKNLLILNLDKPERLFKIYTDLGLVSPPELRGEGDIFSVHEYGTFFRILYNASYLSKANSQKALELLTRTKFNQGLVAKLPQNLTIAHKFGEHQDTQEGFKQLHDCGIVYYPSYPYLLCVMTRGEKFEDLEQVIQEISLVTYQKLGQQIQDIRD